MNFSEFLLTRAKNHTGPGPLLIEVAIDPWDAFEAFTLMSKP